MGVLNNGGCTAQQTFTSGTPAAFCYQVETGSPNDTGEAIAFQGSTSGPQVGSANIYLGAPTPGVTGTVLVSNPADGAYCTVFYEDGNPVSVFPWTVGNGPTPTCTLPQSGPGVATTTATTAGVTPSPSLTPVATVIPTAASTGTVMPTFTATPTGTPLITFPTSTPITSGALATNTPVVLATSTPVSNVPPPPPPPGATNTPTATPVPTATSTPAPSPTPTSTLKHFLVSLKGSKMARGRSVTFGVHVQGTHGHPIQRVTVKVFAKGVGISKTLVGHTGKHGTATFHNVKATKAGNVVIRADKSGYQTVKVRVTVK